MKDYKALSDIQEDLNKGIITCENLVNKLLEKISKETSLNAFLETFDESAKLQARLIDEKLLNNSAGKLAGMVIGIKDNIVYRGHKVSASSKMLENFESLFSATVVERLLAEDAIIIGRLNCDEFAMGSSTENSAFGVTKNAANQAYVPGGSSGGSAVAVQAGLCLASLGSDTGGSIRQPASYCGIVGVKPTYGRVSRNGLIAFASSFDQIGPFTHTVEDAALLTEIISGHDRMDSTTSNVEVPSFSQSIFKSDSSKKYKIAYIKDCLDHNGLNEEVRLAVTAKIEELKSDGHIVEPISFPFLDYMVPAYYVLTTAEASSNLARYDGVHFGYRSPNAKNLEETYVFSRSEGFGAEVKRRIMLGTYVLSAGYYDAYYAKAQKVRRVLRDKTNEIFSDFDFILSPTTTNSAFKIGQKSNDPIEMYLEDIFTVQANLVGAPAISIPLGKTANNMPFGLQLMAKAFDEKNLFNFSATLMNKQ
ncbi:Asp-tRNA(Asn)/Glu-tRNA(Gln) amidotransferase subunit GatA [Vicingaceae bacterium]|nr:Asp-tRNA(Asn)/Glu-tRNA(Gln) amidotransferase subunit GatA [Vicingaceae bacterium]